MKYIDDLSFSNLVSLIQGEDIKGADVLNSIAHEKEQNNLIVEKLEKDLSIAKSRNDNLVSGAKKVLEHLGKKHPLAVQRSGYIIVVTKENISIERNVL